MREIAATAADLEDAGRRRREFRKYEIGDVHGA
jgi:hypothetical protein